MLIDTNNILYTIKANCGKGQQYTFRKLLYSTHGSLPMESTDIGREDKVYESL